MNKFEKAVELSKEHFPKLSIKYKNNNFFMKLLSYLLFFNKDFKNKYITTIGNTVYYPSEDFVKNRPISSIIILLHELVHISDSIKYSSLLFSFLYLFPQILVIFFLPLILLNFKLFLLLSVICLLPLPAYFRMKFELRAYQVSLYCLRKLFLKYGIPYSLETESYLMKKNFNGPQYYFMWTFSLNKDFNEAIKKIEKNEKPFEDKIFDKIDEIIEKI